jgi:LysR family transcriptional regulator for bpeEF and oprC
MDKLRGIQFFCTTVEQKSFAAAAHDLRVVPSAVSKAIAALEGELGFKLMNRSTRHLALTAEGAAYYEKCRMIIQDLEEAEGAAGETQTQLRGRLRVGMHPALWTPILRRLAQFTNVHPTLKVEIFTTNSAGAVLEDGLDAVLHIGRIHELGVIARQLGSTAFVVCASPAYIDKFGCPRRPRDLVNHEVLVYGRKDEDPSVRWEFVRGPERELIDLRPRVLSRDGVGLLDAAIGGCGIARPYALSARERIKSGHLRELLTTWTGPRHPIYAVLPATPWGSSVKVRAFINFVARGLGL